MIAQVVIGGPDGRTRHEGTDNLVRPLLAAQQGFSKRGGRNSSRNSAGYQPLRRRAGGIDDRTFWNRAGIPSKHQFLSAKFSRTFRLPGSLIPGLRRALQPRKQSRNRIGQYLHVLSSLLSDGSDHDRRKRQSAVKA